MATQGPRRSGLSSLAGGIDIGIGLLSMTLAIVVVTIFVLQFVRDSLGLMLLVIALGLVLIAVPWVVALRNSRFERATRARLRAEHPGALVERVRLWRLPHGRLEPGTPIQFLIADPSEVSFETANQTVLLRIPVEDIGLIDLVAAQGDRARDRALTIIYGDEQLAVQLFTVTYTGLEKLRARVRTATAWPPNDTP